MPFIHFLFLNCHFSNKYSMLSMYM